MVEPEDPMGENAPRGSRVPTLFFLIALAFVVMLLVAVWYRDVEGRMPDAIPRIFVALGSLTALVMIGVLLSTRDEAGSEPQPVAWICKYCLKPYVPGATFYPRCAAPQTFFAGTGKYETIYAQAWCLGKAAHYPSRLLHVLVLVVIAGAAALSWILWSVSWRQSSSEWSEMLWIQFGVQLLLLLKTCLLVALALYSVKNWMRRARGEEPLRPEIEYGAPPWWSYDAQWALPEFEEEPGEEATPEVG